MATHTTAKTTKGWAKAAPRKGPQRRSVYARCGRSAFLLPDTKKPGYSKYPVIATRGPGCQLDCRGLRAAKAEATKMINLPGMTRAERKQVRKVAARAETLGRRARCRWAR